MSNAYNMYTNTLARLLRHEEYMYGRVMSDNVYFSSGRLCVDNEIRHDILDELVDIWHKASMTEGDSDVY